MPNELNVVSNEDIKNLIYTIRGKQVMLDSDVARLFEYETKDLNRNVKNNIERFPEYYCFQLTNEEYKSLRCKNFTLNENGRGKHRKYLPYVFTEYGITMLAGLLKSQVAVNVSIRIVNTFIEMKRMLSSNNQIFERLTKIEYKMLEYDKKFDALFNELQKVDNKKLYHCGASIKDLGKKCFGINRIEDECIIEKIINI